MEAGLASMVDEQEAAMLVLQIPSGSKGLSSNLHGLVRSCRSVFV